MSLYRPSHVLLLDWVFGAIEWNFVMNSFAGLSRCLIIPVKPVCARSCYALPFNMPYSCNSQRLGIAKAWHRNAHLLGSLAEQLRFAHCQCTGLNLLRMRYAIFTLCELSRTFCRFFFRVGGPTRKNAHMCPIILSYGHTPLVCVVAQQPEPGACDVWRGAGVVQNGKGRCGTV